MDPWYEENLRCPFDHLPLQYVNGALVSSAGREYPVLDGVPVMLADDVEQTMGLAHASLQRAKGDAEIVDRRAPDLYLESLGISEAEKEGVVQLAGRSDLKVDPVVAFLIAATI